MMANAHETPQIIKVGTFLYIICYNIFFIKKCLRMSIYVPKNMLEAQNTSTSQLVERHY